jgi:diguanylate cyclase (GGDEF)-like protein
MESTQLLTLPTRPAILLVDDDGATRTLVSTYAAQQGYAIHNCRSAEEALKRLRENFCPIVITDLNMPGMDGLEFCRELRARKWPGYTYIVMLTGDHEHGAIAALEAGADDCLRKDAPPAELKARLRVAERIVTLEHRLRRTLEARARQAATDALTGLPNRRAFDRQFNADGHLVGDEVLRHLAGTLKARLPRQFDILARFGGEEFVIVLPHTDREAALQVAERLRTAVESTSVQTSDGTRSITISIGIGHLGTRASPEPMTTHDLLDEADRCLYESKRQGRNRVTAFPPAEPRSLADGSM